MKKILAALLILIAGGVLSLGRAEEMAKAKGKTVTVTGTLVDTNCYLKDGATGNDHDSMKACGRDCLKDGIPAGVLADGKLYVLIFPAPVFADYVGKAVEITGTLQNESQLLPDKAFVVGKDGKKPIKLAGKVMM